MKRNLKILALMVALIGSVMAFASCSVKSISVAEESLSQTVFVEGQDLDLSGVKLVLNKGKKSEEIPVLSGEVTVSGYQKDKLGSQVITVGYKKLTTQFTVNVVPRFAAVSADVDYFIGNEFNAEKGEVKITKNDGTNFVVKMSDKRLSVTGFENEQENLNAKVSLAYSDSATGESYSGYITAKVHAIHSDNFVAPRKIKYSSHDSDIDLTGACIILSNANGSYKETIAVTKDMVSGFDLSKAGPENAEKPLNQQVKVVYGDREYEFTVEITYSNISRIKEAVKTVEDENYDWSGDTLPNVTARVGNVAVQTMTLYLGLSDKEKRSITAEEVELLVRPAMLYSYNLWTTACLDFSNTIGFTDEGEAYFVCKSYSTTKADIAKLKDTDHEIYVFAELARRIGNEFSDVVMIDEITVGDVAAAVYDPENLSDLIDILQFAVDTYDSYADIPDEWTVDILKSNYASDIKNATSALLSSDYVGDGYRDLYSVISAWRSENDLFEILFAFYYSENESETLNALAKCYLPGSLENLYRYVINSVRQLQALSSLKINDTTNFMFYYDNAVKIVQEIEKGDNELYKKLLEELAFEGFATGGDGSSVGVTLPSLIRMLKTYNFGYFYHCGAMLDEPEFIDLWQDYLLFIAKASADGIYLATEECHKQVERIVKKLTDLPPTWQYGFLLSLNSLYGELNNEAGVNVGIGLAMDPENINSTFVYYVLSYYNQMSTENVYNIFVSLMKAMENHANTYTYPGARAAFIAEMEKAIEAKKALVSDEDIAAFEMIKEVYDKYVEIYNNRINVPTYELEGEWEEVFNGLIETLKIAGSVIDTLSTDKPNHVGMISTYEVIDGYVQKIMAEDTPATVKDAYLYAEIMPNGEIKTTLEYFVYCCKHYYNMCKTYLQLGNSLLLYDMYNENVATIFKNAYDVIWFDASKELTEEKKAAILSVMNSLRTYAVVDQAVFAAVDTNTNLYYAGLKKFFAQVASEKCSAAIGKLLDAEKEYVINSRRESSDALDTFKSIMKELSETVTLEGDDATAFNTLVGEMYNYYLNKYNELK